MDRIHGSHAFGGSLVQLILYAAVMQRAKRVVLAARPITQGSSAWSWKQFDRMQRVARQVALATEARYSEVPGSAVCV